MVSKLLLTGFTYYREYCINPSELVVEELSGHVINGFRVHGLVLPVSLGRALSILNRYLRELKPEIVVGVGLAPRAKKVVLELAASNVAHYPDTPDVDGSCVWMKYLDDGGLRVLATRLPVHEVMEYCSRRGGHDITVGLSIGSYLCNAVAYMIHRYAWDHGVVGGFIHIPPHTDLALRLGLENYMPLKHVVDAIGCIISTVTMLYGGQGI